MEHTEASNGNYEGGYGSFFDETEFEVREHEKEKTKKRRKYKARDKEKYHKRHRFDDDEFCEY